MIVSGTGTSGILAQKFAASLTSVGQPAIYLHPTEAMHGSLGRVPKNGAVIFLSNSGNTLELKNLISHLNKRLAKIVSITGNADSFIANIADVSLEIANVPESDPLKLVPTSSAISTLMICDQILCAVEILSDVNHEIFYENHPSGKLGGLNKLIFKDVMRKATGHPAVIDKQSSMKNAIHAISNGRMGACFILDNEKVIGIFTDGDLRRLIEKKGDLDIETNVLQFSNKPKVTVGELDLVFDVLERMESSDSKVTVFPVLDAENRFIGIAHLHDILEKTL